MTVDSAGGTAGCHQIECAEPSPSECVKIASVYARSSAAEESISRRNGGRVEDLVVITCQYAVVQHPQINPTTSTGSQYEPRTTNQDSGMTSTQFDIVESYFRTRTDSDEGCRSESQMDAIPNAGKRQGQKLDRRL